MMGAPIVRDIYSFNEQVKCLAMTEDIKVARATLYNESYPALKTIYCNYLRFGYSTCTTKFYNLGFQVG